MPDIDRRDFLRIVSASAGAAAAAGCSDPVNKLIPYVVQPEEITPGIATYYASTCQGCSAGCGLLVTTREGRPIKLEGNPEHPINRGALCALGQVSIGLTYHPDRYRGPMRRNADTGALEPTTWDDAIALLAGKTREAGGRAWMLGGEVGPTESAWLDRFVAATGAGGRVVYEPFAPEALREASRVLFGSPVEPTFDLSKADFILDLGSDFLEGGSSPVEHARQLAEARDVNHEETRGSHLVSVGPRLSMTASNADEWVAAKPGAEGVVAAALLGAVVDQSGLGDQQREIVRSLVPAVSLDAAAEQAGVSADTLQSIAAALTQASHPVVLPPGAGLSSRRATATAGAVLVLNWALGAFGREVRFPAWAPTAQRSSYRATLELLDAMKGGQVQVLLVHDSNPAYSLPAAVDFAGALENVPFVVSFASIPDETSERADLILPDHTALESWGDAQPRAGVRSVVQPTIRPLFDTRAMVDTLLEAARVMGLDVPTESFRALLQESWADTDFRAALLRGGVFEVADGAISAPVAEARALEIKTPLLEGEGEFVVYAHPSPTLQDGRGANLGWLQELPDPVTKVTWQSWAEISPAAAARLGGLEFGDVIAVETTAGSLELPVVPRGVRDDVVAVGQGHTVGSYASDRGGARGVNINDLLPSGTDESGGRAFLVTKANVRATGGHYRLAMAQTSQDQRGRGLGQVVSLLALAEGKAHVDDPAQAGSHGDAGGHGDSGHGEEAAHGEHHLKPFAAEFDSAADSPYRWGMAVDLDRCTGCSACVAACYIENNIPVVGEEGVRRGRYMAWLRIERWVGEGSDLSGSELPIFPEEKPGDVEIRHSLAMCQHCGAAPCEPVCPVIATYHSDEGLNGMIYNRCIGTRYCSNNCPYKVRRYNWYDYEIERWPEPMGLMANPEVTVRGQGVMEKCTFCVQRIARARQTAKDEGRPIADGEVTTACAQSCPTRAITFGNLKDPGSAVVKKGDSRARGYHALHELNTRPAVTYLAKVTRWPVGG